MQDPKNQKSVDVLAIGAHPDDIELTIGGSILLARAAGLSTVIAHMTCGELGTRGTPEIRREEAAAAAAVLDSPMEILGLPDGHLEVSTEMLDVVVRLIRRHRPRVVLAPLIDDLHPDHEATGQLVKKAAFLAGVAKWHGDLPPWRPDRVMYYMSHTIREPHLLVDISPYFEKKSAAAKSYRSQFFDPSNGRTETFISRPEFWTWWEARHAHWGHMIGVRYAEAFWLDAPIPSRNPFELFTGFGKYKNS